MNSSELHFHIRISFFLGVAELAGIFVPCSLYSRNNSDSQHDECDCQNVVLRNVKQMCEIGYSSYQDQITNCINAE